MQTKSLNIYLFKDCTYKIKEIKQGTFGFQNLEWYNTINLQIIKLNRQVIIEKSFWPINFRW